MKTSRIIGIILVLVFALSGCVTVAYMDRVTAEDEKVLTFIVRGGPSIGDPKAMAEWNDYWTEGDFAHYKVGMRESEDLWTNIKEDWRPQTDWLKAWWEKYKDRDSIGGK